MNKLSRIANQRRVDFVRNSDDFEVALLGALGFSLRHIGKETGLSQSQISYRLRKASIRLSDYRNGVSPYAEEVSRMARKRVAAKVRKDLPSLPPPRSIDK